MDEGCGGWGVAVIVGGTEGGAEDVDGLALEAEPNVGVDAGGDADVGVAEGSLTTTRSTPCSKSRAAVEYLRSWKRMVRSPALRRS